MVRALKSELNMWFLDDGSLGGDPDTVLRDLKTIIDWSSKLGLRLNFSKCEMMVLGTNNKQDIIDAFTSVTPGIIVRDTDISLLGAPLTDSSIKHEKTRSGTFGWSISKTKLTSSLLFVTSFLVYSQTHVPFADYTLLESTERARGV